MRAVALAGAGFAEQQHRDVAVDHPAQHLDVVAHRRIGRMQALERATRHRRRGRPRLGRRLALRRRDARRHLGARRGIDRGVYRGEPAALAHLGVHRLGAVAGLAGEAHERAEAGVEHPVHALAAQRVVVARTEQLERGAVRAADYAVVVEGQHALARGADKLAAAVEAHQVEVVAGRQQRAVFDVLRRHVDQRQRMALRIGRGAGDVERREQVAAHVEDGRRRAGERGVLREEVVVAVDDHRAARGQAGAHAVGAHLALAPHHPFAETAAARGGGEARVAEVAEDHPIPVGEHDAVLGMLHELAERFHLDARDGHEHPEPLAAHLQVGPLDAVRAPCLLRVECVVIEAAGPGTPDDFRDRKLPAVPADQTAQKIRMAVRCRSCTHHNQGSPSNRSSRAGSVTSAAELALRCPVVI